MFSTFRDKVVIAVRAVIPMGNLPEGKRYQILHLDNASSRLQDAILEGETAQVQVTVVSPDKRERLKLRLEAIRIEPNSTHDNIWHITDARVVRITPSGRSTGQTGTCNGWFSTVPNPGAIAGELDILFKEKA